jgi:hypothetical protein
MGCKSPKLSQTIRKMVKNIGGCVPGPRAGEAKKGPVAKTGQLLFNQNQPIV